MRLRKETLVELPVPRDLAYDPLADLCYLETDPQLAVSLVAGSGIDGRGLASAAVRCRNVQGIVPALMPVSLVFEAERALLSGHPEEDSRAKGFQVLGRGSASVVLLALT